MNETAIVERLFQLTTSGSSLYESESDKNQLSEGMLNEIIDIANRARNCNSPQIEYLIGIAYRNFTAWHIRGDAKKLYLEKAVHHLQRAIDLGDHLEAKVEMTRILIDEMQVRDLDKALQLAADLKKARQLPFWINSSVERAKRLSNKMDIPNNNNFSNINATPASIREERIKLRKILINEIKKDNLINAKKVASRLYNLGLLASYLYKDFDGYSGVGGSDFDAAVKVLKSVKNKFNFEYLGRITDTEFLSPSDYKRIEKMLNPCNSTITSKDIEIMLQNESP